MLEKEVALSFSPVLSFPFQPGTLLQLEHGGAVRTLEKFLETVYLPIRGRLHA